VTTMLWPDEIRTPDLPILDEDVPVQLRELRAAVALVAELSGDFTPATTATSTRARYAA